MNSITPAALVIKNEGRSIARDLRKVDFAHSAAAHSRYDFDDYLDECNPYRPGVPVMLFACIGSIAAVLAGSFLVYEVAGWFGRAVLSAL